MQQSEHIGGFSYREYSWRHFKKNKPALLALYLLGLLLAVALLADFIANDQPLYASYKGKTFYPAFQSLWNHAKTDSVFDKQKNAWERLQFDITDWRSLRLESVIWAPIPYAPDKPDKYNRNYTSPFGEQYYRNYNDETVAMPYVLRHHLGTNKIGNDVAAGIIHGTRIALRVGIIAMSIAAFLGILLGAFSGYYGDYGLTASRAKFYFIIIGLILGFFYAFIVRKYTLADAAQEGIFPAIKSISVSLLILMVIVAAAAVLGHFTERIPWLDKQISIPVDIYISRSIEIFDSMPRLLLILTVAALFREKSLFLVMSIIGLTSWTGIARLTRAEFLRNRGLDYIQAARALGYNDGRIMFRHALPNAMAPIFVSIAFGIASAILAESSLSFLGIGVPDEVVTWGSMLSAGRQDYTAWWMVIFPGLAIFITITIYNLLGEGLRDALDPRARK